MHFVIGIVDDHARKLHPGYGYSLHVCAGLHAPIAGARSFCKAQVPLAAPGIDPRYLSDPRDLADDDQGRPNGARHLFRPPPWRGIATRTCLAGTPECRTRNGKITSPRPRRHDLPPGRSLPDGCG